MADRSPRLSDEEPGQFDAPADRAGYDPGRDHDPDHDANRWRHLDEDPDRDASDARASDETRASAADGAGDGLSEGLALYGDGVIPDDDHHLSADMIDDMHGGETSDGLTATGSLADEAALHGARPIRGEEDTRPVWINEGEPISWDKPIPPHVQAAFEEAIEAFRAYLDAFFPKDTQMGDHREGATWGKINSIQFAHDKMDQRVKEITTRIETLHRTKAQRVRELGNDGASREFELETSKLKSALEQRLLLAMQRDHLARFYFEENHKVWAPRSGTHVSEHPDIGSTIDERDFEKARKKVVALPEIPEGTLVVVTGTKVGTSRERLIESLNAYHKQHPDMILLHGNSPGTQRLAAQWAARRNFGGREIALQPDFNAHPGDNWTAIKKRDAQMIMAGPDYVLSFTGPGEKLPYMHRQAIERGIAVEHITNERHSRLVSHPRHEPTSSRAPEPTPAAGMTEEPGTHAATPGDRFAKAHEQLAASFSGLSRQHGLSLDNFNQGSACLYEHDQPIGSIQQVNEPDTGMPPGTHILTVYGPPLGSHEIPPDRDPAAETFAILADRSLSASFDSLPDTHHLSLGDVEGGYADLYRQDRQIGTFQQVLEAGQGYPLQTRLLELDGPPSSNHVIPPGKDAATETVAILERQANLAHLAEIDRQRGTTAQPAPRPELIDPAAARAAEAETEKTAASEALDALIDRILPPESALPEAALPFEGQDPHPLRTLLKSNIVAAVHATISGPDGAHEQLSRHTDESADLAEANIDSDIDVAQRRQNEEQVAYASDALAGLEVLRETVEHNYEEETGERWTPDFPWQDTGERRVTGASAEARRHIEKLEQDQYQSRLPPGDPIAVTAYNSNADRETVYAKLDQLFDKHPGKWIAHGNKHGTPLTHVTEWARENGIEQVHFYPDWKNHPNDAVAQRDLKIARLNPIGVIEFNDGPKPTKLAQEMAKIDEKLVWPIRSPKTIAAEQTRDRSQERAPTEQQSRDRGQDIAAGMSL